MESKWELELARRLDHLGIQWTRGHHQLPWKDSFGEEFIYQPDFYLVDHDIFIEVKGEHLMFIDETQEDKQTAILRLYKNVMFVRSAKACREFTLEDCVKTVTRQECEWLDGYR